MPPQFNPLQLEAPHRHAFLIVLAVLLILTGIFGVWYFSNPLPEEADSSTSLTTIKFADWRTYKNEEYGFEFKYPAQDRLVDVGIVIDEKADPLEVCTGNNTFNLTPEQLFTKWKNNPPSIKGDRASICYDYPSYAKISTSSVTVGNTQAYKVTNLRGSYKTICTYVTSQKTAVAICLPAEDPKFGTWQQHYDIYNQILSTFKFISTSTSAIKGTGQFCGGSVKYVACPIGYDCKLGSTIPGSGGKCEVKLKKYSGTCITVVVPAKNKITGEIYEFGSPCEVPDGWTAVPAN